MSNREFSVYWWDPDGAQHEELRFVTAEEAIKRSFSLANGPAAAMGIVKRVLITDGGDCCVFDWNNTQGVVWPLDHSTDAEMEAENGR